MDFGVSDSLKDVLGLQLSAGRWFEPNDDAQQWDAVVINQKMKEDVLDAEDPLGKNIAKENAKREQRVVGIVSEFRRHGEFFSPYAYAFERGRSNSKKSRSSGPPHFILGLGFEQERYAAHPRDRPAPSPRRDSG